MIKVTEYRKFPNKGAGRRGNTLGGAVIRERAYSPSSGFLQNENRTIFGREMAKTSRNPVGLMRKGGGGL